MHSESAYSVLVKPCMEEVHTNDYWKYCPAKRSSAKLWNHMLLYGTSNIMEIISDILGKQVFSIVHYVSTVFFLCYDLKMIQRWYFMTSTLRDGKMRKMAIYSRGLCNRYWLSPLCQRSLYYFNERQHRAKTE